MPAGVAVGRRRGHRSLAAAHVVRSWRSDRDQAVAPGLAGAGIGLGEGEAAVVRVAAGAADDRAARGRGSKHDPRTDDVDGDRATEEGPVRDRALEHRARGGIGVLPPRALKLLVDRALIRRRRDHPAVEDVLGDDDVDLALGARFLLALRHAAGGLAVFGALLGAVRFAALHVLVAIVVVAIVGA